MDAPKRNLILILLAVVGALQMVTIVLAVVILVQMNTARAQDAYDQRVTACEASLEDPYGEQLEEMIACVDRP